MLAYPTEPVSGIPAIGLDAMRKTIREKDPLRPSTRLNTLTGEERTSAAKRRGVDSTRLINLVSGDLNGTTDVFLRGPLY